VREDGLLPAMTSVSATIERYVRTIAEGYRVTQYRPSSHLLSQQCRHSARLCF
jgi:hypothetical protein